MSDRRIALWIAGASFLFFLLFQHGHFKGSDELAVFEMTRSLYERGDLAVPALRHTEVGVDGRRYSYFAPGQAVLALPLYALASPARALLPESFRRALAGPPNRRGVYRFGGELEASLVGLFAPAIGAVLVALFYAFQRELGVSATRAAGVAALLAAGTHTTTLSTYFLRHLTEAATLLGALMLFRRYARGASLAALATGSALASLTFLVRVPAALAGPVLAAYLAWALHVRGDWRAGWPRLVRVLAAVLLPLGVAVCIHVGVNELRWGSALGSPMVEQQSRFNNPLLRGLAGLLLSPGSSIFVYSPPLLLAPFGLAALWRRDRALTLTAVALALTWLVFYARFDGWSGLWSAPGPRYMYLLVPLLLLPLGLWLRGPLRWGAAAALGLAGLWVQLVSVLVRWGSVPNRAGWPILAPDQSPFLFEWSRSPVVVMSRLLFEGDLVDSWWWSLWHGWPGFPGRPGAVVVLLSLLVLALAGCGWALFRGLRSGDPCATSA